jgi:hypothetical protein
MKDGAIKKTAKKPRALRVKEETAVYCGGRGKMVLYRAADGSVSLDVRLERDSIWLNQKQMAELFATERSVITKHLRNIFQSGELDEKSNVQKMHIPRSDKPVAFYNLDVAISIGYRVNSKRGTQFRIWATKVLREHVLKGYTVNERRLKELNQTVRLIADVARRDDAADRRESPARERYPHARTEPSDRAEKKVTVQHPGDANLRPHQRHLLRLETQHHLGRIEQSWR